MAWAFEDFKIEGTANTLEVTVSAIAPLIKNFLLEVSMLFI